MNQLVKYVILGFLCPLLGGCIDHRVDRSDDQAMMIYRECMSDMRTTMGTAKMSGAISNAPIANENTPLAANARSREEQNREIHCMQQAGWKN
ncbi:MAG: hypothetical protein R3348_02665 [Xanthomonadales bacterium]|nr:hypothetical protein [Xanthomonadales bacterium]